MEGNWEKALENPSSVPGHWEGVSEGRWCHPRGGDSTKGQHRCHPTQALGICSICSWGRCQSPLHPWGPRGFLSCREWQCPLPPQSQTQPLGWWDAPWGCRGEGLQNKARFLRQGALSWLGRGLRGCPAYSPLPQSEGFREHQWDHSCESSPEPLLYAKHFHQASKTTKKLLK